jgi:hypothetical protein
MDPPRPWILQTCSDRSGVASTDRPNDLQGPKALRQCLAVQTAPPTTLELKQLEQDLVDTLLPLLPKHLHAITLAHTLQ